MKPEYFHLLLVHIPIHGLLVATIGLFAGILLKQRMVVWIATVLVLLCSLSIPFIMYSGEATYERYQTERSIVQHMDFSGMHWAMHHADCAEKGAKMTYLLIAISIGSLIVFKWKPIWYLRISIMLLIVAILAIGLNGWIASSGGKIRRPDFQHTQKHFK